MPRFFRRLAEGVFDEEDLVRRAHELADFIEQSSVRYGFDRSQLFAVGYSNGANIASATLLLRPGTLAGAALLRAMVPLIPEQLPDLKGTPVLLAEGNYDPIVSLPEAEELAALLRNAGASVTSHFEDAGHGLTEDTVTTARRWLEEHAKDTAVG
jgi:predicted esterase